MSKIKKKNGKFLANLPFDTVYTCSFASFLPNTGCKHLDIPFFLLCAIHVYQNSIIVLLKTCLLVLVHVPACNFFVQIGD